jgi:hypothetical protein
VRRVRAPVVARAAYGLALVASPRRVVALLGGPHGGLAPVVVARVLGVRHLLQSAITTLVPGRRIEYLAVMTDTLHAASDVIIASTDDARVDRRWRRVARCDAVLAAAFAVAGVWGSGGPTRTHPQRMPAKCDDLATVARRCV